jgi:hypothetical protein
LITGSTRQARSLRRRRKIPRDGEYRCITGAVFDVVYAKMEAPPALSLKQLQAEGTAIYTNPSKVIFVVHVHGWGMLVYSIIDQATAEVLERVAGLRLPSGRAHEVLVRPELVYALDNATHAGGPVGDPRIPAWFTVRVDGSVRGKNLERVCVSRYVHASSVDRLMEASDFRFHALDVAVLLRDCLIGVLALHHAGAIHGDVSPWNVLYSSPFRLADGTWAPAHLWGARMIDFDQACAESTCTYSPDTASQFPLYFHDAMIRGGSAPRLQYVLSEVSQVGVTALAALSQAGNMDSFFDQIGDLEARWQTRTRRKALVDETITRRGEWLARMRKMESADAGDDAATLHTLAIGLAREPSLEGARDAADAADKIIRRLMDGSTFSCDARVIRGGVPATRDGEPASLRRWQTLPESGAQRHTPAVGRAGVVQSETCRSYVVAPSARGLRQFVPLENMDGETLDAITRSAEPYVNSSNRTRRLKRVLPPQ